MSMRPTRFAWSLAAGLVVSTTAVAQVAMPPVNMGSTSFNDGMAGPGILIEPGVLEHYHASHFVDSHGADIPGRNSIDTWANLLHVGYITAHKIAGGFYGAEFLIPVASVELNTDFGPRGKQSGLGDLIVSPLIIQWPSRTVFGKPYFARASVLAILPTGAYDADRPVNVGSNAGGAFAYYAFTILPLPKLETSLRIFYLWNAKNATPFVPLAATSTQAGQAIHGNYAMSYELSRSFRIGVNGYAFQQLTDHRMAGSAIANSKERVVAIGPGAVWSAGVWSVLANVDFETFARNRPEGRRVNVTLRRVFPHAPPAHHDSTQSRVGL